MKKIKSIAMVWEQNAYGGVDSYLSYLLNSKYFSDISVTIYVNHNNEGLKRFKKNINNKLVNIIEYKSLLEIYPSNSVLKKIYYFLKPLLFIMMIFKFKKLFEDKNYDVLIGQCGGYGHIRGEMAAILAAKNQKIHVKTLVIHHACTHYPPFMGIFLKLINHIISKSLSSVICVSYATRETLFNKSNLLDREALHDLVIHNGIPKFRELEKFNNIKEENKKSDFFKVCLVSRIEDYKGHADLISAVHLLPEVYKKRFKFYFVGKGEIKNIESLNQLINKFDLKNYFVFSGYLDKTNKEILSNFDLALSLTRTFEGFGLSIAEAMSAGIPLIVTEVGAISEYINNTYCKIIPPSSILDLKKALISFVEDNKVWRNRSQVAKDYINNSYHSDAMAQKYLSHFEQILNLK